MKETFESADFAARRDKISRQVWPVSIDDLRV